MDENLKKRLMDAMMELPSKSQVSERNSLPVSEEDELAGLNAMNRSVISDDEPMIDKINRAARLANLEVKSDPMSALGMMPGVIGKVDALKLINAAKNEESLMKSLRDRWKSKDRYTVRDEQSELLGHTLGEKYKVGKNTEENIDIIKNNMFPNIKNQVQIKKIDKLNADNIIKNLTENKQISSGQAGMLKDYLNKDMFTGVHLKSPKGSTVLLAPDAVSANYAQRYKSVVPENLELSTVAHELTHADEAARGLKSQTELIPEYIKMLMADSRFRANEQAKAYYLSKLKERPELLQDKQLMTELNESVYNRLSNAIRELGHSGSVKDLDEIVNVYDKLIKKTDPVDALNVMKNKHHYDYTNYEMDAIKNLLFNKGKK